MKKRRRGITGSLCVTRDFVFTVYHFALLVLRPRERLIPSVRARRVETFDHRRRLVSGRNDETRTAPPQPRGDESSPRDFVGRAFEPISFGEMIDID